MVCRCFFRNHFIHFLHPRLLAGRKVNLMPRMVSCSTKYGRMENSLVTSAAPRAGAEEEIRTLKKHIMWCITIYIYIYIIIILYCIYIYIIFILIILFIHIYIYIYDICIHMIHNDTYTYSLMHIMIFINMSKMICNLCLHQHETRNYDRLWASPATSLERWSPYLPWFHHEPRSYPALKSPEVDCCLAQWMSWPVEY